MCVNRVVAVISCSFVSTVQRRRWWFVVDWTSSFGQHEEVVGDSFEAGQVSVAYAGRRSPTTDQLPPRKVTCHWLALLCSSWHWSSKGFRTHLELSTRKTMSYTTEQKVWIERFKWGDIISRWTNRAVSKRVRRRVRGKTYQSFLFIVLRLQFYLSSIISQISDLGCGAMHYGIFYTIRVTQFATMNEIMRKLLLLKFVFKVHLC